uniref:Uncharacterized protein n=1 Tax=Ascaris lumbricoides TaxID=6252 RepID=A0A0M3IVP4_ASCLU
MGGKSGEIQQKDCAVVCLCSWIGLFHVLLLATC